MDTITKVMSKDEIFQLKEKLKDATIKKTPQYAYYQIKTSECTITAYQSGKVVFQGNDLSFMKDETSTTSHSYPECGSDEVGTGDYFGPMVVCACQVEEKDLKLLNTLKIQDSKQLKDEDILKIAPVLKENLKYSLLILENEKYNIVHKNNNMNEIKAKMHNQAFVHLLKKINCKNPYMIIDQFAAKNTYYKYIQNEKEIIKNIHFETKAENKYLSVACASIIARYTFLEAMDQLNKIYDFEFPKGAGNIVDKAAKEFTNKYGEEELKKVAKYHFKNTLKKEAM